MWANMPWSPLDSLGRVGAGFASAGNPNSLHHASHILLSVLLSEFQLSKENRNVITFNQWPSKSIWVPNNFPGNVWAVTEHIQRQLLVVSWTLKGSSPQSVKVRIKGYFQSN